jgi:hypothetical protein
MRPRLPPSNALKAFEAASIDQPIAETERKYAAWMSASECLRSVTRAIAVPQRGKRKDSKPTDHGEHLFAAFRHRDLMCPVAAMQGMTVYRADGGEMEYSCPRNALRV